MQITYSDPLSRAWARMKKALFQPFQLSKWFALGFTAFLAALLDGYGGSGKGGNYSQGLNLSDYDEELEKIFNFPAFVSDWMQSHPILFTVILFGIVFILVLTIVLTWVSSRGKFMFLDNVVHDRAEVVKPWNDFSKEGNSLFVWRLIFGLVSFGVFIIFAVSFFQIIRGIYYDQSEIATHIFSLMGIGLAFLVSVLLIGVISLFLNDFVVPIMYKNRIKTSQAWMQFLQLLSRNIGYFIVYALFIFVLAIATALAIVIFGFVTLCIGFLLIILPYIGSVVLLPVSYTFRAFSLEFLEQFGDEFKVFPDAIPAVEEG